MAEEPGAGGHSGDDEPVEADADGSGASDGGAAADAPEGDPETGADAEDSEDEAEDTAGGDVPDDEKPEGVAEAGLEGSDSDAGTTEDEAGDAAPGGEGSDAEGSEADDPEPIGAVTDADDPPEASAPDVDGGDEGGDWGADEGAGDESEAAEYEGTAEVDAETEDEEPVAPEGEPPELAGAAGTADETDVVEEGDDGERDYYDRTVPEDDLPGASGGGLREGPPDDEEMPLADHIEEMVLRLAIVCAVAAVVAGAVFFFEPLAEDSIMFIWDSVLPEPEAVPDGSEIQVATNPRVYGPLELKLAELKFASLAGFVLALPVFVYETYRFMRPGLYPRERRYYLAAVPTSLVLAFVGVSFAYFIILPAIFAYFVRYSERAGLLAFALRQTFDLILVLMGYMALVFQIPLFIMLAIMMGLTDRQWLEGRRLYFWGGFLGVSFLFVPEPTGMAPILVALTMIGLFEGTLALLRWTGN